VNNGGGLGAVGGVLGKSLGDNTGHGTSGTESESGNRETHCDRVGRDGWISKKKLFRDKVKRMTGFKRM
jgi:hypothetical protein